MAPPLTRSERKLGLTQAEKNQGWHRCPWHPEIRFQKACWRCKDEQGCFCDPFFHDCRP